MNCIRIKSFYINNLTPVEIVVEAKATQGKLIKLNIIGLADNAIKEAKDRVLSSLKFIKIKTPESVLINLAPAEIKKEGVQFDLAMAVAIWAISVTELKNDSLELLKNSSFLGELSLFGDIRSIKNCYSLTLNTLIKSSKIIFVPKDNYYNESLYNLKDITKNQIIIPVSHLQEVFDIITTTNIPYQNEENYQSKKNSINYETIFSDIKGQNTAKRALIIAATGKHNILMSGPPGCGKTMLASRFPLLLSKLTNDEIQEVCSLHSIAEKNLDFLKEGYRPYRSPHHTISLAGLIGGGSTKAMIGEVSLAHKGVLFLDELTEFNKKVLDALRIPLESGNINLTRSNFKIELPANFQLIAAMNPCPCGRLNDVRYNCQCSQKSIKHFWQKISQPLLDRIDLIVSLQGIDPTEIILKTEDKNKKDDFFQDEKSLLQNIEIARKIQLERTGYFNAHCPHAIFLKNLNLAYDLEKNLNSITEKLLLTGRTFIKVLRVARTIADLRQSEYVEKRDFSESLMYRNQL